MLKGTLYTVHSGIGPMLELAEKERDSYVKPLTVRLKYRGRDLIPTQFDKHGNPQIGGMMRDILLWENRELTRRGEVTGGAATLEVEYAYTVSKEKIEIPLPMRLPQAGVCPICGQPITLEQLDNPAKDVAHPEHYYNGFGPRWGVALVSKENAQPTLAHNECYERYHTLRWTDVVMTAVEERILKGPVDEAEHLHWGEGENEVQVEEIPSQDLSKLDHVRCPWFRFRAPFGSFEIRGGRYATQIVLLPDFEEFELNEPSVGKIIIGTDGNRMVGCGSSLEQLRYTLFFIQKAVRPDKPIEEVLAERLHENKGAGQSSGLSALFSLLPWRKRR